MNSCTHPLPAPANIKVVILIGPPDFGRCPLGSRLNRAYWPVFGKPAVERTIDLLADQGLSRFVICRQSGPSDKQSHHAIRVPNGADVAFLDDSFPRGPAGCLRDAIDFVRDDLLLVMPASLVSPPDVRKLLTQHCQAAGTLSVFLNPRTEEAEYPMESGIYLCSPEAVRIVPEHGYMDLKEGLIRELARLGKPARAFCLEVDAGNFRTWQDYLDAVGNHLIRHAKERIGIKGFSFDPDRLLWTGRDVVISRNAGITGPAVIGEGAVIEDGVVLRGPAVLDRGVYIGKSAVVDESVAWEKAVIGPHADVSGSLVDRRKAISANRRLFCGLAALTGKQRHRLMNHWRTLKIKNPGTGNKPAGAENYNAQSLRAAMLFLLSLAVLLLYTYRQTLADLWSVWMRSDEYSSGLLVPVVAGYILWTRRQEIRQTGLGGPCLWGLAALAGVQILRWFGFCYQFNSLERLSLVLSAGALTLAFVGRRVFKRLLPVYGFLFLMLPLPKQLEMQLTVPLQQWATASAVFSLEMLGFNVWHEGNIINIDHTRVAVAEACNGLRMLTAFLVVSGMVVLVIHRSWRQKLFILLSSIPIALICNTIRLAVTAVSFTMIDAEKWERAFHDFGGFAMMPVALGIIVLELWILSVLMIAPGPEPGQR
jgi:exosortase